jgi:phage baseplate assembly protein W
MASELIGRGWAYPCTLTPGGAVQLRDGGPELDAAIAMIIATAPGERVMRPDFGCTIWESLFDPVNARTLGLMEQAVREAVTRWEPRVELESVTAAPAGDGCVELTMAYRARATNDYRNLVYPFYVIPQEVRAQ